MKDSDIIFITTTLQTKWLVYQKEIIKNLFPESEHLIIDGSRDWPYSWFYWMDEIKKIPCKWFVHIDEDCFLESREELIKLIEKMEEEEYSVSAVSDGFHHYRGANGTAINSFFMVGKKDDFLNSGFDYKDIKFNFDGKNWSNSKNIIFDREKHSGQFYPHAKMENGEDSSYEQEPYYALLWKLRENGKKFYYLYPSFDQRFKSTNPRIDSDSEDIAIHMWYTRMWESPMDVHGTPNIERYRKVEEYLLKKHNYLNKR